MVEVVDNERVDEKGSVEVIGIVEKLTELDKLGDAILELDVVFSCTLLQLMSAMLLGRK